MTTISSKTVRAWLRSGLTVRIATAGIAAMLAGPPACSSESGGSAGNAGSGGSGGSGGTAGSGGAAGSAAECGNGKLESGEDCDTAIASGAGRCPTASDCVAGAGCTKAAIVGSGCATKCVTTPITTPVDGDGCCPGGATHETDDDCAISCGDHACVTPETCESCETDCGPCCGNGRLDSGELCDTGIAEPDERACPTTQTCVKSDACVVKTLSGRDCRTMCEATAIIQCSAGDGCCPAGCTDADDDDCACTPTASCPAQDGCGSMDDGCGHTLTCGSCAEPLVCGGLGTPNVCAAAWQLFDQLDGECRLRRVWGLSPNEVWVGGGCLRNGAWEAIVLRWLGGTFEPVAFPHPVESITTALWGSGPGDLWASTNWEIFHWNGSVWESVPDIATTSAISDIWGSSPTDVWFLELQGNFVVHLSNGTLSSIASPSPNRMYRIWGSIANDVWAGGEEGILMRWQGSGWTLMSSDPGHPVSGISGTGPNDVWVQREGLIHWDGSTWSSPGGVGSCVWAESQTSVWAGGGGGQLRHFDGASWKNVPSPTTSGVTDIWGSSATDMWAVTIDGAILRRHE